MKKKSTAIVLSIVILLILIVAGDYHWIALGGLILLTLVAMLFPIVNWILLFILFYVLMLHGLTVVGKVQQYFQRMGGKKS